VIINAAELLRSMPQDANMNQAATHLSHYLDLFSHLIVAFFADLWSAMNAETIRQ